METDQMSGFFSAIGKIAIAVKDWLFSFTKEAIDYLIAYPILLIPITLMFFVISINTVRRFIKGV